MEQVYRTFNFRLSNKKMADIMYAVIMTSAKITSTFCLCYQYTRSQNSYNGADMIIHIHEKNLDKFEELAGVKLEKCQVAHVN